MSYVGSKSILDVVVLGIATTAVVREELSWVV